MRGSVACLLAWMLPGGLFAVVAVEQEWNDPRVRVSQRSSGEAVWIVVWFVGTIYLPPLNCSPHQREESNHGWWFRLVDGVVARWFPFFL